MDDVHTRAPIAASNDVINSARSGKRSQYQLTLQTLLGPGNDRNIN